MNCYVLHVHSLSSCENERANGVLKNLKTYLLNTMGQEIALEIHYKTSINLGYLNVKQNLLVIFL